MDFASNSNYCIFLLRSIPMAAQFDTEEVILMRCWDGLDGRPVKTIIDERNHRLKVLRVANVSDATLFRRSLEQEAHRQRLTKVIVYALENAKEKLVQHDIFKFEGEKEKSFFTICCFKWCLLLLIQAILRAISMDKLLIWFE
jgi:hypothetical protein